jgi:hypothetical protein
MALRTSLLAMFGMTLLSGCGDKPRREVSADMPPPTGAAPSEPAPSEPAPSAPELPDECTPRLAALLAALPSDDTLLGQRVARRECSKPNSAIVQYGTGEPRQVTFSVFAYRVADTDLAGGLVSEDDARQLLEAGRNAEAALLAVQRSHREVAAATTDPGVDTMTPEERARLPRAVALPGGGVGEVFFDSDRWTLLAAYGDHHSLRVDVLGAASPWASTDQAYPQLTELAARVRHDALAK